MERQPAVAEIVRSGFVEGRHYGAAVHLDPDGTVRWSVGDVTSPIYPRSCNKPLQALAMVRSGLALRGRLLALACASHDGEDFHLEAVRELLRGSGIDESALQTPPGLPLGSAARAAYLRAGYDASPIAMNCSGKHAAMLATCIANGWSTEDYLDPRHRLQKALAETYAESTGEPIESVGVDGCGAPLLSTSLIGLARAFGGLVRAVPGSAEAAVRDAIVDFPEYVSGSADPDVPLQRAFPGAIGKRGAEACFAFAMPDGAAFAGKIDDGGDRARLVVLAEAMRIAGYEHPVLDEVGTYALHGGRRVVGAIRPTLR